MVTHLTGRVVDESGAGVPTARAQLCLRVAGMGTVLCLNPATADASGNFAVDVPANAQCVQTAAMRVLLPSSQMATTYCPTTLSSSGGMVALGEPLKLYSTTPASGLPPIGDENTPRTITLADGLQIDVTPANLGLGGDYATFSARRVDTAQLPCFARDAGPLLGLYAFLPEVLITGEGFPVRIPNTTGLAPGARVDLMLLGGLDTHLPGGQLIEEAHFEKFGTGTVSSDGQMIASDPGSEVPYLSWLGYRLAR